MHGGLYSIQFHARCISIIDVVFLIIYPYKLFGNCVALWEAEFEVLL